MKRWKVFLAAGLFLVLLGGAVAVYADTGGVPEMQDLYDPVGPPDREAPPAQGRGRQPPPPRGLRGEVTAVSEMGLTLLTRGEVSVQVNVDEQTQIWLVETQGRGTLEDIEVGDRVLVRGMRARGSVPGAPAMDARAIVVVPDGDEVHGRIKAVEGSVIAIENREGEATIVTSEDTRFWLGWREGSLQDVAEGRFVVAFGETQGDGSLLARLVYIHRGPPGPPLGPPPGPNAEPDAGGPGGD